MKMECKKDKQVVHREDKRLIDTNDNETQEVNNM